MVSNIPSGIEETVAEHGSVTDALLLALVQATEEQTATQEKIMDLLAAISSSLSKLAEQD
jgi:hypothetical protein